MQRNSTAVTTVLNFISTKKLTITTNCISGTKGLWCEQSMARIVYGTNSQWYERSMGRMVHGTNCLHGGAEIARPDIARPDNPAQCLLRWFRLPSVLRLDVEENDWTVCESVPTSTTTGAAIRTDVCDGGLWGGVSGGIFFQITVQTFSIIIATFPATNTYLCRWRCLLVNNIWLYDCALGLTGALPSLFH